MRSGRRRQGCLCERVLVWHPRTLSKGHVDVVTGEWVAVGIVCVCVGGRERERVCVHLCIYGGDGRGNERDDLMTICPLRCP